MGLDATENTIVSQVPPVLLLREAAAIARVSPGTLRAAIRRGELAAVRVGSGAQRQHARVTREALLGWLGLKYGSHGEILPTATGQAPSPAGGAARPASTNPAARPGIADTTGRGARRRHYRIPAAVDALLQQTTHGEGQPSSDIPAAAGPSARGGGGPIPSSEPASRGGTDTTKGTRPPQAAAPRIIVNSSEDLP